MTTYQTLAAIALEALADPNDSAAQAAIAVVEQFELAVATAPGRATSGIVIGGQLNQAIRAHVAGWSRLSQMAVTSSSSAAASAYESEFTSANGMLTAAGASTVPFSFSQASNAAMLAALTAAALLPLPTPYASADLSSMATTITRLWSPTLTTPAPATFAGPVGDEQNIDQLVSAAQRYVSWLAAGG